MILSIVGMMEMVQGETSWNNEVRCFILLLIKTYLFVKPLSDPLLLDDPGMF